MLLVCYTIFLLTAIITSQYLLNTYSNPRLVFVYKCIKSQVVRCLAGGTVSRVTQWQVGWGAGAGWAPYRPRLLHQRSQHRPERPWPREKASTDCVHARRSYCEHGRGLEPQITAPGPNTLTFTQSM